MFPQSSIGGVHFYMKKPMVSHIGDVVASSRRASKVWLKFLSVEVSILYRGGEVNIPLIGGTPVYWVMFVSIDMIISRCEASRSGRPRLDPT